VKRTIKRQGGKSAFNIREELKAAVDILEEAVYLLRATPFILAPYYIGTLPFILGFLYFWTDMSTSVNAWRHCSQAAWGMVVLFVWMKTWQSVYTRRLLSQVKGEKPPSWGIHRILRVVGIQTAIQPWGIVILPLAFIVMLPFPQAHSFFQNATLIGGGEEAHLRSIMQKSWRQASLWPMQNTLIIWLASPLLLACAALSVFVIVSLTASLHPMFVVFLIVVIVHLFTLFCPLGMITALNIGMAVLLISSLLKTLFDIETIFSMLGFYNILNDTFFAVVCTLSYLCLDPLIKASYCLRCFYGEALHTGEDLKVELRPLVRPGILAILVLVLFLTLFPFNNALARPQAISSAGHSTSISAQQLDAAIESTINHPKYTWRMPREKPPETVGKKNFLQTLLEPIINVVQDGWHYLVKGFTKVLKFINDILSRIRPSLPHLEKPDDRWTSSSRLFIIIPLACIVAVVAFLAWRAWKKRRPHLLATEVVAQPTVDITHEDVDARALPEDGWLTLARELMKQGDMRLALRALYLATLASLARQDLITIAKYKSDREYELELRRHSHVQPHLVGVFAENRALFERAWYGLHEVTPGIMENFSRNQERISADAQR
jgi:hypothetical protein